MNRETTAWIVLAGPDAPPQWQDRAVPAVLIPLLPSEFAQFKAGRRVEPRLSSTDERIASLLAAGASQSRIAQVVGLSLRTVQRRVGFLKRSFGVQTAQQLAHRLAAIGFEAAEAS
jgi:DNA-binding NarL/FixJ family response regulator